MRSHNKVSLLRTMQYDTDTFFFHELASAGGCLTKKHHQALGFQKDAWSRCTHGLGDTHMGWGAHTCTAGHAHGLKGKRTRVGGHAHGLGDAHKGWGTRTCRPKSSWVPLRKGGSTEWSSRVPNPNNETLQPDTTIEGTHKPWGGGGDSAGPRTPPTLPPKGGSGQQ